MDKSAQSEVSLEPECFRHASARSHKRIYARLRRVTEQTRNSENRPAFGYAYSRLILRLSSRQQRNGTLYLGVTRDLIRRVHEHKQKAAVGFTARYDVGRLVWFEHYDDPTNAITREKEIKKWRRAWKIELIEKDNPEWCDLYPRILG